MVKEEPVNGGVPIYHLFEEEAGVTSCSPGLTAASSGATASCLYTEEVRAEGKVGCLLTNAFDSLTHSVNVYCLYLYVSNTFSWGSHGLRGLLLMLVERLSVIFVMCRVQIPNQWGGMEGGSGYPGSSPNFAAALDKSHHSWSVYTNLCYCIYHIIKMQLCIVSAFSVHTTTSLRRGQWLCHLCFLLHYLNTWYIISS